MYNSIIILISVSATYALTAIYFGKIKKKPVIHIRIWNIVMAITFLVSALLGLILAVVIDLKFNLAWYYNVLWLHVEFGIIMTVISLFHLLRHLKYYRAIFKK